MPSGTGGAGGAREADQPDGPPASADLGPRALAGAGWTVFLLLAVDRVAGGVVAGADPRLLAAVPHEGPLYTASLVVTNLGDQVTVTAIALLGTLLLLRRRAFLDAGLVPLAKAVSATVLFGLKGLFDRARPTVTGYEGATAAFPSGHATETGMVFLLLAVLLFERNRRWRPWAEGVALGLAVVVGLTRLALGAHWPTDVVAGWGLGFGLAGTFLLLRAYLRRRIRLPWAAGEVDRVPEGAALGEVQPTGGARPRGEPSNPRPAVVEAWTPPPGSTSTRPCAPAPTGSRAWTGAASAAPTRPR
jgi:undecaprenyl-diphosphatase